MNYGHPIPFVVFYFTIQLKKKRIATKKKPFIKTPFTLIRLNFWNWFMAKGKIRARRLIQLSIIEARPKLFHGKLIMNNIERKRVNRKKILKAFKYGGLLVPNEFERIQEWFYRQSSEYVIWTRKIVKYRRNFLVTCKKFQ